MYHRFWLLCNIQNGNGTSCFSWNDTTTGSQYTPTGAKSNFTTGFKDSFTKSSILTALGMAFLKDMLAAVENPLLKNAIKEYMDCLEEENKARAKILEYEEDI
jgi:hypothetical protein